MRNVRALCLAAAGALALGGCVSTSPLASRGGGPVEPTAWERSVRRSLTDDERYLEARVAAGELSPESIDELRGRAPAVLAAARRADADGRITEQERLEVLQLLHDAVDRAEQRVAMPRAWAGGPAYWR